MDRIASKYDEKQVPGAQICKIRKIAIYGMDFRISKDKKEGRGINTF